MDDEDLEPLIQRMQRAVFVAVILETIRGLPETTEPPRRSWGGLRRGDCEAGG